MLRRELKCSPMLINDFFLEFDVWFVGWMGTWRLVEQTLLLRPFLLGWRLGWVGVNNRASLSESALDLWCVDGCWSEFELLILISFMFIWKWKNMTGKVFLNYMKSRWFLSKFDWIFYKWDTSESLTKPKMIFSFYPIIQFFSDCTTNKYKIWY